MSDLQQDILESIDIITDAKIAVIPYDYTIKGKVISINNTDCVIEVNGEQYSAKIKDSINIVIGDVVFVQIIRNDFSDKVITGKIGTVSGDGTIISADWVNITNKPNSPITAIDNAVANQHSNYQHNQISSANTWSITHNLGRYPNATIVDSAGNVVIGEIFYISENQIEINFTSAFSGKAFLN